MLLVQMGRMKSTAAGTSKGAATRPSKGKRVRTDQSEDQPSRKIFMTKEKEKRHKVISNWTLIPERPVKLQPGEYDQFLHELMGRNWMQLATLYKSMILR